jgi:hypothetical protein
MLGAAADLVEGAVDGGGDLGGAFLVDGVAGAGQDDVLAPGHGGGQPGVQAGPQLPLADEGPLATSAIVSLATIAGTGDSRPAAVTESWPHVIDGGDPAPAGRPLP